MTFGWRYGAAVTLTALALCCTAYSQNGAAEVPAAKVGSSPPPQATRSAVAPMVTKAGVEAYVNRARKAFNVPGIAVAIVKDGRVVLEQGYGVRNTATGAPVDAHTMFAIASNTKAFTSASLEMLADRGKLDMSARVIKYLPWFRMSNAYVTREMRVHDLLAHDSGLPKGQTTDLLFTPDSSYTGKQVAEHLAHVPLGYSFRARTAYDNILYGVAALVIEDVSGKTYRSFLKQNIFDPLKMHDTRFNYHYILASDKDVATGYVPIGDPFNTPQGHLIAAPKMAWTNSPGAAGIYSSVHDMATWILTQLAGGVYGHTRTGAPERLFSESSHQRMWRMQSIVNPDKEERLIESKIPALAAIAPNYQGFAEGWHVSQYRHHKMVFHTGGWPGFVSRVTMIPELHLGVIVLTNQRSGGAFNAITNHILDMYMGMPKADWINVYLKDNNLRQQKKKKKWQKFVEARDEKSGPSLPASDYAGTYHSWYGNVTIEMNNDGSLVIKFPHTKKLVGTLSHWSYDTFAVRWDDRTLRADAFITFDLTPDGKVRDAHMSSSPRYLMSYEFNGLRLTPNRPKKGATNAQ